MVSSDTPWLAALFLLSGAITFLTRLSFIGAEGRIRLPSWFRRWLPLVPVAALTALIAPDLVLVGGQVDLGFENPRLVAGMVAVAVAARWRNTLLTIGAGFAVFVGMRWLVPM